MIYRHNSLARRFVNRKNIALVLLVSISAFALLFSPIRSLLTQAVYAVAPGVWGAGNRAATAWGDLLADLRTKESLMKENENLTALTERMQAQVLDRNLLAERVSKLEDALGRAGSDNRVVANVLSGPGKSPYDTLALDAGGEQGISVGDMVVYAGSGVIGEVVEAAPMSAKIKLYSSPGEEHTVLIGSHTVPVVALGRGMGNFEAKVPQDSAVAIGDTVVLAKGNLIFGTVSLVEEKPAEPFKRIFFRVPFNISEIRTVEVIVGGH